MVRRGTEKRQRTVVLTQRFNEAEAAEIKAIADRTGMSVASLVRHALLNKTPPRAVRRPTADHRAVAQLLADLARLKAEAGKHGSNLNQIAHHLNAGRPLHRVQNSLEGALDAVTTFYERDMAEFRHACLQALGYERGDDEPEPPFA